MAENSAAAWRVDLSIEINDVAKLIGIRYVGLNVRKKISRMLAIEKLHLQRTRTMGVDDGVAGNLVRERTLKPDLAHCASALGVHLRPFHRHKNGVGKRSVA